VEAKGYGSFVGPHSASEHSQPVLPARPAWPFQPASVSLITP